MTDPKLTQSFITQQHLVENAQQALADLHAAMQEHGPDSLITAYFQERHSEAHKALVEGMSAVVDYIDSQVPAYPDSEVFTGTPAPPQVSGQELATTQWVQEYVTKHLPKQPRPWSATDLAITVLSGVLGGLIVTLVGALLLLLLP